MFLSVKPPVNISLIPELLCQVKGKVKSKPKIALLNVMVPQQLMYTERLYCWEVKLRLFVHSRKKENLAKKINSAN